MLTQIAQGASPRRDCPVSCQMYLLIKLLRHVTCYGQRFRQQQHAPLVKPLAAVALIPALCERKTHCMPLQLAQDYRKLAHVAAVLGPEC